MNKPLNYAKLSEQYKVFGDLGDQAIAEMKEEEQEKEEKKKIRHELFLRNYRDLKKGMWTKEKHTLPYNRLDTEDNLNINVKEVTEEEVDKEYNNRHPKLTKAEKARKAEDKWREEFEARQSERRRATEEAEEYGEHSDDDIDYTRDFVAEWDADVAVRTNEITSAIADKTLRSISLTDANNMNASEPYDSKSYPGRQYVLIGDARIWIGENTVIRHNGQDTTLKKINFLNGGKGKKTNKRKTNKRKTNKRKTNKRKTNKRKTNKRKTNKRKTNKRKTNKRK